MDNEERLSFGARRELIHQLDSGTAKPDQVRELLAEYVACVSAGESVPIDILQCLRDRFAGYLSGSQETLDRAFCLVRKRKGNPGADEEKELEIAMSILKHRLRNSSAAHQEALETVAAEYACGTTKAGTAWRHKRQESLETLRLVRAACGEGFTAAELERAKQIVSPEGRQN